MTREVSDFDKKAYGIIRQSVSRFLAEVAMIHDADGRTLLDIAPQDHAGAREHFKRATARAADIDAESGADFIMDICQRNEEIVPDGTFDFVVCTEVLEHTLNPFAAVDEIRRMLKPGGYAFVTTPFNFRIHGPLPDCWRFTVHGLNALFRDFSELEVQEIEDEERFLMPVHYTTIARK